MEPIEVHVWSDIACPWCYVGRRRLERAVRDTGVPVSVVYRSYELAPDTPVDFEGSEVDFLAHHKGMPVERVEEMLAQMTELAATEGLHYDFGAVRHTRTVLAHEALHHARTHGRQGELVERLFAAYFTEGRHVGHVADLVALGADVGLDPDALRADLEAGTWTGAVRADIAEAHAMGVRGVPFTVVDGRYGVSGAQASDVFAEALRRAAADRAPVLETVGGDAPACDGDACDLPGPGAGGALAGGATAATRGL